MNRFNNDTPVRTRAFRNALIMSIAVGVLVYYQGDTVYSSLTTLAFTFAVVFPALWLSYRFTQKLVKKAQQDMEKEVQNEEGLQVGQAAPDFAVYNQHHQTKSLDTYPDKNLVLYFYPKDDTPGCTIEANQFTALADQFAAANTQVLGISKDNCESHQAFIEKFDLAVELLADTEGEMCEAYQVWREKVKNGETKMGIVRSTFVLNAEKDIVYAEYGVAPEGHAQAMLEKVQAL